MSAIAAYYPDPSVLVNKQICVVTNLEPRKFRGYESQGMIMAVDNPDGGITLII
jgi:methionyl-tRNA synthetase